MIALGYVRVSSTEQIEGTSIQNQIDMIQSYCSMKMFNLHNVFVDAGVSGSIPLSERQEGRLLVETIATRTHELCVVITKLDRGFRSASDCLINIESWQKSNVGLHILNLGGQTINTSSSAGKFFITVMAAASEMERNMIRERCNEGRNIRKAQGQRIGEIPFGFTLSDDGRTLIQDSVEMGAVRRIHELYDDNISYREICRRLDREGYKSRSSKWNHHTVKSIIFRSI